jgi:hypothetical protein
MSRQVIYLDKPICRSCTHLVGELGTKTKSCTYKKGNLKCPAHLYKIEVGVDTEAAVEQFYLAIQAGDTSAIVAALTEAQANPKINLAILSDLQDRLFEVQVAAEGAPEVNEELQAGAPTAEEIAEDLEDEDEDVDA